MGVAGLKPTVRRTVPPPALKGAGYWQNLFFCLCRTKVPVFLPAIGRGSLPASTGTHMPWLTASRLHHQARVVGCLSRGLNFSSLLSSLSRLGQGFCFEDLGWLG